MYICIRQTADTEVTSSIRVIHKTTSNVNSICIQLKLSTFNLYILVRRAVTTIENDETIYKVFIWEYDYFGNLCGGYII